MIASVHAEVSDTGLGSLCVDAQAECDQRFEQGAEHGAEHGAVTERPPVAVVASEQRVLVEAKKGGRERRIGEVMFGRRGQLVQVCVGREPARDRIEDEQSRQCVPVGRQRRAGGLIPDSRIPGFAAAAILA